MATVAQRLAGFLRRHREEGIPRQAVHESQRLLLNQLKASVAAADQPVVRLLVEDAPSVTSPTASMLWVGGRTTPSHAAMVNGALFEVLDFHDTYIPTYLHAVSGVAPAVLAAGEAGRNTGAEVLGALTLGIEVELACAEILMPTGYFRGFVPLGLVGGVGAAAGCAVLAGLDVEHTTHALALAMCTAGGTYASVGSMALPYITALQARSGLEACRMAAAGLQGPVTAFEGDKGMLESYSDESPDKIDGVLAELGRTWRIHGQSYKTMPTETITHGPLECALDVLARSEGRTIETMRFGVSPIVVRIADERYERFGLPSSELEARFDLRYCVAAAWVRGRFTLEEMAPAAFTDPGILDLRSRVELRADEDRPTFDGCWLEVGYTDGSADRVNIDAFAGTVANPLSDDRLTEVFTGVASEVLPLRQVEEIAAVVWDLHAASDITHLMSLCVR
jgi:2-methylcitrate dehydratase PrpD